MGPSCKHIPQKVLFTEVTYEGVKSNRSLSKSMTRKVPRALLWGNLLISGTRGYFLKVDAKPLQPFSSRVPNMNQKTQNALGDYFLKSPKDKAPIMSFPCSESLNGSSPLIKQRSRPLT